MAKGELNLRPAPVAGYGERPTVLLIDDDAGMLESLAMMLDDHGFNVLTARDGRSGLRMFRMHQPAAVLTDIVMPEEDGIGILLQIRRERPETKVIVLSGKVERWNALRMAKKLGADAAVEKGRDPLALVGTLNQLLER